mmetsp:Transcript_56647/g.143486  ORF Transcript_56647/g.143486 Transcript_56647/m.143486 type:complete len:219 (-) Transcript_56647:280-936(-)
MLSLKTSTTALPVSGSLDMKRSSMGGNTSSLLFLKKSTLVSNLLTLDGIVSKTSCRFILPWSTFWNCSRARNCALLRCFPTRPCEDLLLPLAPPSSPQSSSMSSSRATLVAAATRFFFIATICLCAGAGSSSPPWCAPCLRKACSFSQTKAWCRLRTSSTLSAAFWISPAMASKAARPRQMTAAPPPLPPGKLLSSCPGLWSIATLWADSRASFHLQV